MSQTTFHEACRFCGCTRHGLSSIGPNVCPRCDVAINIAGTQPPGVTFDQYRDFILEVVAATDLAPRHPGERWSHYRSRAILVLNVRREGKADPGVSAETSFARDAKGDRFRQAAFPRVANCIAATAQTASSSEAGRGAQIADRAKDHAPEAVVTTMTEIECAHPREQLEKIGPRYRCTACRKILRSREVGLNPRALNLDPDLRGLNPRAAGRNTRATGRNPRALKAAYYRMWRESSVLRDGGYRLEFVPWEFRAGMAIRRKGKWLLRVYPVDGGAVEAALVDPDGNVRTYA